MISEAGIKKPKLPALAFTVSAAEMPVLVASPSSAPAAAANPYIVVTHANGWRYYHNGVRITEARSVQLGSGLFEQVAPGSARDPELKATAAAAVTTTTATVVPLPAKTTGGCTGCKKAAGAGKATATTPLAGPAAAAAGAAGLSMEPADGPPMSRGILSELSPGTKNMLLVAGGGGLFFLYLRSSGII